MRSKFYSSGQQFSAAERERFLAKYQASGLTQREFAREHGVKLRSLRHWLYGFSSKQRVARPAKLAFREVNWGGIPLLESWAAELRLPNGLVLRLNGQASADWVGALIERLG